MPRGPQLVTIYWRDIPTQVNGANRREKHQQLLHPRFMKAVDRAAMRAGITTHTEYIGQWRRESEPAEAETLADLTSARAAQIEQDFPLSELDRYVATGGYDPQTHDAIAAPDSPGDQRD